MAVIIACFIVFPRNEAAIFLRQADQTPPALFVELREGLAAFIKSLKQIVADVRVPDQRRIDWKGTRSAGPSGNGSPWGCWVELSPSHTVLRPLPCSRRNSAVVESDPVGDS
jgi:hypothetical protein